ncbi:hypothetical protein QUB60_05300 [Microcoleus sp. A2-C5]|uniref:hypothetical protein n=1 Tax=unclassified Microcoleus TaxID=2642155 RepID=UPI002FD637BD
MTVDSWKREVRQRIRSTDLTDGRKKEGGRGKKVEGRGKKVEYTKKPGFYDFLRLVTKNLERNRVSEN